MPKRKLKRKQLVDEAVPNKVKVKEVDNVKQIKDEKTLPTVDWRLWGPYLSERQWGTVREDFSHDKDCWNYVDFRSSSSYSYKQGEDGLFGWCDKEARLCASLGLWNGKDEILKERLFGLSGPQGNHGEDVKELYYYLDATPDHKYNKALYKYPQSKYPYTELEETNKQRTLLEEEYELIDTGIFTDGCWDVTVEYVKQEQTVTHCCYSVKNNGLKVEKLHILPQFWFRNTWSTIDSEHKPNLKKTGQYLVEVCDNSLSQCGYMIKFHPIEDEELEIIFTENETNPSFYKTQQQTGQNKGQQHYKDGFHQYIIKGDNTAIKQNSGTKCTAVYKLTVDAGQEKKLYWTIKPKNNSQVYPVSTIIECINNRKQEADSFYFSKILPSEWSTEEKNVARQAIAGLLWSKQYYYYNVQQHNNEVIKLNKSTSELWNSSWKHLICSDIISVPDKWEFPWFAPWDLAFQMIVMSHIDTEFSKQQILLLLSDRYIKPTGQIPGCEFDMNAANPPLHAWAVYEIYQTENRKDREFLQTCYTQLLKNYNWWVKEFRDPSGCDLYSGGFLGLDNISEIDRTHSTLPTGSHLQQADGTGWTAFFCLSMLQIAVELGDLKQAELLLDQFISIAKQITVSITDTGLWCNRFKFFYDVIVNNTERRKIHNKSMAGMVPLFACRIIELPDSVDRTSQLFTRFNHSNFVQPLGNNQYFLFVVSKLRFRVMISTVFNNHEFLAPYGIRSLSKVSSNGTDFKYCPGESNSKLFGGNSNWRGPVWLPMNYMLIESLKLYDTAYSLTLCYPWNGSTRVLLSDIILDLKTRLSSLFLFNKDGVRPLHGDVIEYSQEGPWKDLVLFYEYFNPDTGRGCGASHQTGWTSLLFLMNSFGKNKDKT